MSLPSKLVLAIACGISASIIGYVHYRQHYDREKMHEGVIKDTVRQQRRKTENLYNLQQQIDLTKELKKAQYDNNNDNVT